MDRHDKTDWWGNLCSDVLWFSNQERIHRATAWFGSYDWKKLGDRHSTRNACTRSRLTKIFRVETVAVKAKSHCWGWGVGENEREREEWRRVWGRRGKTEGLGKDKDSLLPHLSSSMNTSNPLVKPSRPVAITTSCVNEFHKLITRWMKETSPVGAGLWSQSLH